MKSLTRRAPRLFTLAAAVALLTFATGARCIEHTSVQVDSQGDAHIYGEMVNDTNIHGHGIIVRGHLLDAGGGVVAEATAPLCPPDVPPGGTSTFDVRFDGVPPHTSFDVRPIAGQATDIPLPYAEVVVVGASTFPERGVLYLRVDAQNNAGQDYGGLHACLAAYDGSGAMVGASSRDFDGVLKGGGPAPVQDRFLIPVTLADLPATATDVRGWIWLSDAAGAQAYQPIMTEKVPIAR